MPKTQPAKPDLRLVSAEAEVYDLMRTPVTTADRVKRLQMEARALAVEQVEALEKLLLQASAMAQEIADGGDAYPVGARELAGRLASDLPAKAQTLKAVASRSL
ncbi:hypothetical protein GCM10007859_12400 [Brevundimonas denitrificans]|uniref:Uncharacterized protein n=1 Tax=Brevundimonas denitrificans TaxID=1443434 RepID=A0ABQ6BHS4_9CAUL|nr:hypothetical protein [Brevundimonas denitrificans]GLS01229.1 hypothetical protein GCM10007859_12400 [Brevundimonas denitrificans]